MLEFSEEIKLNEWQCISIVYRQQQQDEEENEH
jgi:hypothetical protein